jgi:hypothetical protein
MLRRHFTVAIATKGPNDEVEIDEQDVLDDSEDEAPSSLDHEALHDDAC